MKVSTLLLLLVFCAKMALAQQVFTLYDGPAPGSENWSLPEFSEINEAGVKMVRNISAPTLTVFRPEKNWNGTSVIVCPGGSYLGLAIDLEGHEIAVWLNSLGITAFVLKYRVANEGPDFGRSVGDFMWKKNYAGADSMLAPTAKLAIADGRAAVKFVRENSKKFNVSPDRVGMMGFSAGGNLTAAAAQTDEAASRPDFFAPIYGYLFSVLGEKVPKDGPPCFMAFASDDHLADGCIDFYKKWQAAGRPVEAHIYPKGGHGFGLKKQDLPCDLWPERFEDWLDREGLLLSPDFAKKANLEANWGWHQHWQKMLENDWGGLARYKLENARLALLSRNPAKKRVVFFGDSITEGWVNDDPSFFEGKDHVGRGIGGQATGQMLVRFRQDVVDLKPATVVILAGTNDIAENTGPISLENILGNLASMAEIGRANGIKVVLCSVLPAADYPWRTGMGPDKKIPELNAMIKSYCEKNSVGYLDYFSEMTDSRNGLPLELAADGVHPTVAGYKIMGKLAEGFLKK